MRIFMTLALALLLVSCSLVKPNPERKILGRWEGTNADNVHLTFLFTPDHIVHGERYRSDFPSVAKASGTWQIKDGLYTVTIEEQTAEGGLKADGSLQLLHKESGNTIKLTKTSTQSKPK